MIFPYKKHMPYFLRGQPLMSWEEKHFKVFNKFSALLCTARLNFHKFTVLGNSRALTSNFRNFWILHCKIVRRIPQSSWKMQKFC